MLMAVFLLAILLGPLIYIEWYNSKDHYRIENPQKLNENAKIIDVQHKTIGLKGSRKWRTTVVFDDGFTYISHKTKIVNHFLSYDISLTNDINTEILKTAILSHSKAVANNRTKRDNKTLAFWNSSVMQVVLAILFIGFLFAILYFVM